VLHATDLVANLLGEANALYAIGRPRLEIGVEPLKGVPSNNSEFTSNRALTSALAGEGSWLARNVT
jgi:hypothetical protein